MIRTWKPYVTLLMQDLLNILYKSMSIKMLMVVL